MERKSLFSGILIGFGAYGFLSLGGLPGAIIFTFGLICVILSGTPLYTGRAGFTTDIPELVRVWLFNALGCLIIGLMIASLGGEPVERAAGCVTARLSQGPWRSFLRAVGCGAIIDAVVWLYRSTKSFLPVLFGVPLFIVCGFYHSIADVVYLVAAMRWDPAILWFYPLVVLGNYVGCNVRRVVLGSTYSPC